MLRYCLASMLVDAMYIHFAEGIFAMDRAEAAAREWARERPDLPMLPVETVGRLLDAAARVIRDHMIRCSKK
ncbi:hypothetical protein [Mesorhizobium sp. M1406]|uniref:hypothetical protein n=1 Tax=Mesorhizobium sp. M1406 TaxID=2957099 RepID=UPI00333DA062